MAAAPNAVPVFFPARNSELCARVGSVHIHSSFDPSAEAKRFIDSNLHSEPAAAIILMGAGLGYVTRKLKQLAPATRVVTLDYHSEFRGRRVCEPDAAWDPASSRTLEQFLHAALPEEELPGLIILDWRPAARAAGARADSLIGELRDTLSRMNANVATSGYFARRWFRNAAANFLFCDRLVEPAVDARPVVIAASGPTLERAAAALRRLRERLSIWALPSAFTPLAARGLLPDMIILTDPGFYGGEHLWRARTLDLPVAAPLTAARGLWHASGGLVLLDQATPVERALNAASRTAALAIDPNGTVAGTALELALALATGPVVFAGFDLSFNDLNSHASPHSFDRYIGIGSNRVSPHPARLFERNILSSQRIAAGSRWRVNRAQATFAEWFAGQSYRPMAAPAGRSRLFRLFPSPVALPIASIDEKRLEELCSSLPAPEKAPAVKRYRISAAERPSRTGREASLRDLLREWTAAARSLPGFTKQGSLFSGSSPARTVLGFLDPAALMRIRRLYVVEPARAVREAENAAEENSRFLAETERTYLERAE